MMTENDQPTYDIAIIGGGPTGLSAAALLASRGRTVLLLERHPMRYALPRAGHIDHEIMRIIQAVGAHEAMLADNLDFESYRWFNGDGKLLLAFPSGDSVSGFRRDYMMFQPVLDGALYDSLERYPNATVRMGAMVNGLHQDEDGVTLQWDTTSSDQGDRTVGTGDICAARARYVIAADGSGSAVREQFLGITREDFGFNERWLDVDCKLLRPLAFGAEPRQHCNPRRPAYIGPLGKRHHRFEFALLEGETDEEILRPGTIWALLGDYGVGPEDVEPFREIVYTFEARVARQWRSGRVFLAGDAAHTMPPHMGQGLCSGVRDSANLAWKLDLVLGGFANDELLDTHETERRPHALEWIEISIAVGKISCMTKPKEAAARDEAFLSGTVPPLPAFPQLSAGIIEAGAAASAAGQLFVQSTIALDGRTGLLHDVLGHGFLVVGRDDDPRRSLQPHHVEVLDRIGARSAWISDVGDSEGFADTTGAVKDFFAAHKAAVCIVRPDYYIYGACTHEDELGAMVDRLASRLSLTTARHK
jgi:3-(3-hydroxy-phenyl)propionate hydroxylase